MNIRIRFMVLISVSLCISLAAVAVIVIGRERAEARQALERQGYALADALAIMFLAHHLRGEEGLISEIAREVAEPDRQAVGQAPLYLVVLASDGRILYRKGQDILDPADDAVLNGNALVTPLPHLTDTVRTVDGGSALDLKSRMILKEVGGTIRRYGAVRLGLSLSLLDRQAARTIWAVVVLALAALLIGMGATYFTTRTLISHLLYLGDRIRAIASGDLQPRAQIPGSDELAALERSINRLAEDLQKRELLKQYISSSTWDEIEKKVSASAEAPMGRDGGEDGSLRKVTVLFMDIRNFTALAESSRSREVVELLNEIFGMMVDIIEAYGGVLDKFIGDALLTVFYPEDLDDDAIRAAYCAVEMQLRLEQFNQRRAFYGRDAVKAGIGINSGQVIAGSIGARTRKDYTVIGDPVNVAARLEKRSKEGRHTHIVISDDTLQGLKGLVSVEPLEGDLIRGRQKPVPVYEIVSVKDVDQILDMLTSADASVREHAFRAVEARQDDKALPVLVDLLENGDEELILRAIVVLGRLGRKDNRIGPVLDGIITATKNKRILATAIKAAAFQCGCVDAERLREFLVDDDARVRANTIEALDILGGTDYLAWVEPHVYDSNPRVRANAAVAMWKRGRFEVGSILERLSYGTSASERACAVFAAGELFRLASRDLTPDQRQQRSGMPIDEVLLDELGHYHKLAGIIKRLIEDPDTVVRRQAIRAAGKARDQQSMEPLIRILSDSPHEQRDVVFETLLKIGLPTPMVRIVEGCLGSGTEGVEVP